MMDLVLDGVFNKGFQAAQEGVNRVQKIFDIASLCFWGILNTVKEYQKGFSSGQKEKEQYTF